MSSLSLLRRDRRARTPRRLATLALIVALGAGMPAARAESRITVLGPQTPGGRGAAVSAGLRIELNVVRVLTLQAPGAAGSAAWSNGGTLMLGCTGQAGCVSRASGTGGTQALHLPASGLTLAQP